MKCNIKSALCCRRCSLQSLLIKSIVCTVALSLLCRTALYMYIKQPAQQPSRLAHTTHNVPRTFTQTKHNVPDEVPLETSIQGEQSGKLGQHNVPTIEHNALFALNTDGRGLVDPFADGIPMPEEMQSIKKSLEGEEYGRHDCTRWHFSRTPLPKTALASFPGSGNTWVRYLIQQLTGIFTGGIYHSLLISERKFGLQHYRELFQMNWDGSVIAFKTHEAGVPSYMLNVSRYDRAILLIRNPYEALIAEYHRKNVNQTYYESGHTEAVDTSLFKGKAWQNHVFTHSYLWWELYTRWLRSTDIPIHVIQYDRLKRNLREEVVKLGQFLGVNDQALKNETHIGCVLRHSGQALKRKRVVFETSPYASDMNKTIDGYIEKVTRLAKEKLNLTLNL